MFRSIWQILVMGMAICTTCVLAAQPLPEGQELASYFQERYWAVPKCIENFPEGLYGKQIYGIQKEIWIEEYTRFDVAAQIVRQAMDSDGEFVLELAQAALADFRDGIGHECKAFLRIENELELTSKEGIKKFVESMYYSNMVERSEHLEFRESLVIRNRFGGPKAELNLVVTPKLNSHPEAG